MMTIQKFCELCGEPLILLTSLNLKKCSGCMTEFVWNLKTGQKSVLIEGLSGGKEAVDAKLEALHEIKD